MSRSPEPPDSRSPRPPGIHCGDDGDPSAAERAGPQRDRRRRPRARDRELEEDGADVKSAREGAGAPRARPRAVAVAATDTRAPPRSGSSRPRAGAEIERGARVSVVKGPFSGKVGVVQEVDAKGGARVMLGLIAVRLDVDHLVAAGEGRARPRLSTSHRKPALARS